MKWGLIFNYKNTYNALPKRFYSPARAETFNSPELIEINQELFEKLNHGKPASKDVKYLAQYFSGQIVSGGEANIALAYSGHQFGYFNPTLGDGRALLLGEVETLDSKRFDIVLKGSGKTAYSRNGDGLSSLGPVIREYIICEAMYALGVPTTRALAAVKTNQNVYRESAFPGGVFTRVASSHIRIGTFEYFASQKDSEGLQALIDYTINRHYPELVNQTNRCSLLVKSFAKRLSKLVAQWMGLGFIHGVMNTDNMLISAETIDYGPCAFMDHFKNNKVYSSIDRHGRYAYSNQIEIAKWNLYKFASCFTLIADASELEETLEDCLPMFEKEWLSTMSKKLGLETANEKHKNCINLWLSFLETNNLDFTNSFISLTNTPDELESIAGYQEFYEEWQVCSQGKISIELMKKSNPYFIPRNHQVEKAIKKAYDGDFSYFKTLNNVYRKPFEQQKEFSQLSLPPKESEVVHNTFCGT